MKTLPKSREAWCGQIHANRDIPAQHPGNNYCFGKRLLSALYSNVIVAVVTAIKKLY